MTASHLAELVPKQRKQLREPGSRCFDTIQDPHQLVPIATCESMENPVQSSGFLFQDIPVCKKIGGCTGKKEKHVVASFAAII